MKKNWFKILLPHFVAILVFIIVAALYCKPALEGKVLQQHDIIGWKGSVQQSIEYKNTHDGKYPLWTNAVFSGMPTFQIAVSGNNPIPGVVHTIMTLNLPEPIQYFFLASSCFYILCLVLGVSPWVGIVGSLGFAYATYNPIIINAGHITKMWSIAYMPALLAGILLIFNRRYWLGASLTVLFASTLIAMNHLQIAYYLFLAIVIMSIFYLVRWIKAKDFGHIVKVGGFTFGAAIIGVLSNAVTLFSTYEYQKETIRGGGSELAIFDTSAAQKTDGLDVDYAFSYSLGIAEPFVMVAPHMFGGSSDKEEIKQENSKAIAALRNLPAELQQQMPFAAYWGGIKDISGFNYTSGPPYIGAVIVFLAIMAMFVLDNRYKWWLLTGTLFTIMLSWGSYFKPLNYLLFDYLPMYNKFRAPSMALVIPQLLLSLLAVLGLQKIISSNKTEIWPSLKKGLIATGGLFLVLLGLYVSLDYLSSMDKQLLAQVQGSGQAPLIAAVDGFFNGLKADRQSLFLGDIGRAFLFMAFAFALLYFAVTKKLNPVLATSLIGVLILIDLLSVDAKYLNSNNFKDAVQNEYVFSKTDVDKAIAADTSYYRVFNLGGDAFNENLTSYHFNSVGGYHAAKLRIYQDIISERLSKEQGAVIGALQANPDSLSKLHTPTLNMLNTKYLVYKERGQTKMFWPNKNAMGPAWFVNNVSFVGNAREEMNAIGVTDLTQTAIVQDTFKVAVKYSQEIDSTASIQLINNDNDYIIYQSNAASDKFAVFSEVYYAAGWKAFIDGVEKPIVKTNYLLRGLSIPAGKHTIEFKFEPKGYYTGKKLTGIFTILAIILLLATVFFEYRKSKNPKSEDKKA